MKRASYSETKELRAQFEASPIILKLKEEKMKAIREMRYADASIVNTKIENIWEKIQKDSEVKTKSVIESLSLMNESDKRANYNRLYALILMSDVFDCILADLKSDLKKYEKGASFLQFEALNNFSKEASGQIKYALKCSGNDFIERFADNSILMHDLILNAVDLNVNTDKNEK